MNKLIRTNPSNVTALIARLALGIVVFPHGAQNFSVGLADMALMEQWGF